MKICVLNDSYMNFGDISWDSLKEFGELSVYHEDSECLSELVERVGDADIIVSDTPNMVKGLISACPNLKYVTLTATGYDGVEIEAARARNIPVSNAAGYGTHSVSQYAISLLLEICGQVSFYSDAVHSGRWHGAGADGARDGDHRLIELAGKTMGVIGFGNIGRAVGRVAKALGMNVIAYNRSRCAEGEAIAEYVTLDELYARADVISLHLPGGAESAGLINRESISKMKDGVIIINNGRGSLIKSTDLAEALHSGKVYAAGLDVIEKEPISSDNPLLTAPHCFITPHISWLPKESRQRIVDITVQNISAFLEGHPVHVVN